MNKARIQWYIELFCTKYWLTIKIQCSSQNFESFILEQERTLNKSLNNDSLKSLKAWHMMIIDAQIK